jgi:hypothetical protein
MQPELKRKKFGDLFTEAFAEYLSYEFDSSEGEPEFYLFDTPNRNPTQVQDAMWRRLIAKHLLSHIYN